MKKTMLVAVIGFAAGGLLAQLKLMDASDETNIGPTNDPFRINQTIQMQASVLALAQTQTTHSASLTLLNLQSESNRLAAVSADSKAQAALDRPTGTDTGAVIGITAPLIAPVRLLGSNALVVAQQALARENITSNAIFSISGGILASGSVASVRSADSSGAVNTFSGSGIYQTTIIPEIPTNGFSFSPDFSANGVRPPSDLNALEAKDGWSIQFFMNLPNPNGGNSRNGEYLVYSNCYWAMTSNEIANPEVSILWQNWVEGTPMPPQVAYIKTFTPEDNLNGAVGTAVLYEIGRAMSTNIVIYRLSEASVADLIASHDSIAGAHNGRITALEGRPIGCTTNTVFPFYQLDNPYSSTNAVLRIAFSNGIFSIWGTTTNE